MVPPHRNRLKELHRYPQHSHIEMAGPEAAPLDQKRFHSLITFSSFEGQAKSLNA